MLMDKHAQTVLTALTFSCITRELFFFSFLLWGAASPEPPHWSVSLFALQFGWAGLFQSQSLLPYGCGLQSVVVGRCPASCCPVCSSPAGEKEDTVSWRGPMKDVVSLLPRFEACIDWLKNVSLLLNFHWCVFFHASQCSPERLPAVAVASLVAAACADLN